MSYQINEALDLIKQDSDRKEIVEIEVLLFPDESVRLVLDLKEVESEDWERVVESARPYCLSLQNKREYLLDALANAFFEEYNEICHPDEPETQTQFLSKIYPETVTLGPNLKSLTWTSVINYLWEDLEDFFGDHVIAVDLDSDLQVTFIDTVG